MKKLKVVELFAGVGGFRLGLEGWKKNKDFLSASSAYKKKIPPLFEVVWSNQYEPLTKSQPASDIYEERFNSSSSLHSRADIELVVKNDIHNIPSHDLLVGGFPCQDYSVAKQLGKSKGIQGIKGVLWWSINNILSVKKPDYVLLENVDRLIKSPAFQRGRDFAIILSCFKKLDYAVEWRVINAAEYGMPQRRRRVFIFAFKKGSKLHKKFKKPITWLKSDGVLAKAFPMTTKKENNDLFSEEHQLEISDDPVKITDEFNINQGSKGVFENSGLMVDGKIWTIKTEAKYSGKQKTLRELLVDKKDVPTSFYIDDKDKLAWEYLKNKKNEERKKSNGDIFFYKEGPVGYPDSLDKPSRTIITSEGGKTPSRFKHVIKQPGNNKLRRLVPIELERANMFPDNHTEGATESKRAFFMGNALVVGVVERIGVTLVDLLKK